MPEYLAPGVYVEEVDTGSKPIEGVSTSTAGMVGLTERGQVNEPTLVTGFADFTRQFGGFLNRRDFLGANWLFPHAVDGFFTNGGKRVYIVRVLPGGATYAGTQLFGAVAGGFASTLASSSRPREGYLLVNDPTNLAVGEWMLLDDNARTEYVQTSAADVLALRAPLATAEAAATQVTPYTFAPAAGPALSTNPTAPGALAGDAQITLDDTTGLQPGGGDVLEIGAGNTVEYVVTTAAGAALVGLAAPLAFDHDDTENVVLVDPTAAPATPLANDAPDGALLIVVDDESVLAGADAVAFGTGTPTEYYTVADLGIAAVPTPLRFRHAAGTQVVTPDLDDNGGALTPRNLTADAAVGATELEIAKRDDLTVGMVLLLTGAAGSEYAVLEQIDPEVGAGTDNPGHITVSNPLQLAYPSGDSVQPLNDTGTDADETQLARAADASDRVLALVDESGHTAPGDVIRIDAAGSSRVEYFALVADNAAPVALTQAPLNTHPAGTPMTERTPVANVQAIDRGVWGNSVRVTALREERPAVDTVVVNGGGAGSPSIDLQTGVGLEVGTLLEFMQGTRVRFRQEVASVTGRTVGFGAAGLEQAVSPGDVVRSAEFALGVEFWRQNPRTLKLEPDASMTEVFHNLTFDPRHTRYIEKVVGRIRPTLDDRGEGESSLIRVTDVLAAAAAEAAERPSPDLLGQGRTVTTGAQTLPDPTIDVEDASSFPSAGSFDVAGTTLTYTGTTGTSFTGAVGGAGPLTAGTLVLQTGNPIRLSLRGGDDALGTLNDLDLVGTDAVNPSDRTGLQALKSIEEISLVAMPGRTSPTVQNALLAHAELMRFRYSVLDSLRGPDPFGARLEQVQAQRRLYDSKYGALYYPWLVIDNPFPQNPTIPEPVWIPPSGHMLGIFARTDNERGVHKAPANEVVRGINDLQVKIVKEQHDILNPMNVNVIRDFRDRGRGLRVWGARNVSSDPDWRYLNVRRLFNFVEASIERGTQWVVFEPNDFRLWVRVTQSVSAFLTAVWRDGALMGRKPEHAFYVKCDETTMSQYDIDNGRLIMVIGIAPVKPAEFVIIRIGQWAGGSMVEEA